MVGLSTRGLGVPARMWAGADRGQWPGAECRQQLTLEDARCSGGSGAVFDGPASDLAACQPFGGIVVEGDPLATTTGSRVEPVSVDFAATFGQPHLGLRLAREGGRRGDLGARGGGVVRLVAAGWQFADGAETRGACS